MKLIWNQPSSVELCSYIILHSEAQTFNCRNRSTFLTAGGTLSTIFELVYFATFHHEYLKTTKICAGICLQLVIIAYIRLSQLSHIFKSLCTPNKSKLNICQNRVTWIQCGCDLLHVFDVYMRNTSGCWFRYVHCMSEELGANCWEPNKSVFADLLGNNVTPCFLSEKAVNRSTAPDSSSSAWQSTWCTGASASHPSHTHTHTENTLFHIQLACPFSLQYTIDYTLSSLRSLSLLFALTSQTPLSRHHCVLIYFRKCVFIWDHCLLQIIHLSRGNSSGFITLRWQTFWNFRLLLNSLCFE